MSSVIQRVRPNHFSKELLKYIFVNSEFYFVVGDEIGHFICEDYNILTKMICLDYGSEDF